MKRVIRLVFVEQRLVGLPTLSVKLFVPFPLQFSFKYTYNNE